LVPGSDEVAVASYDVFGVFDALGIRWLGNDGTDVPSARPDSIERTNRAAIIQQDPQGSSSESPFGKNNGLGDIEVLCSDAPRLIGDLVWFDADGNGVQDPPDDGPVEPGLPGVRLELRDETDEVIATTRTNDAGRYRFIVERSHTYHVEISPEEFVSGSLKGTTIAPPDAFDRGGADNDAVMVGGRAVVRAAAPDPGGAVLNYDIGVVPVTAAQQVPTTVPPPSVPPTTMTTQPPDELDGGLTSRTGPGLSSTRTARALAATGTTVAGLFSLALGLLMMGLVLLGVVGRSERFSDDADIEGS
jgi:hypothetical protein